ncbi:MAG: hypothetical protein IKY82_05035 [Alistipes sp.]|nr:hypothetical protein [Alistipes sp.]
MKKISTCVVCCMAVLLLQGCFKDVVNYTQFQAAVFNQTESGGEFTPAVELESYAYYVDTLEWKIASYEDAVARRLTNKLTGKTLTEPDVVGEFNPAEEYQLSIKIESPTSMLVVVNPTMKLYAYRKYTLPVNLPSVLAKLYMASWRKSHNASGWWVVNDFYAPPTPTEPTPPADEEEEEPEVPTPPAEDEDTPAEDNETPPAEDDGEADEPTENEDNDNNLR